MNGINNNISILILFVHIPVDKQNGLIWFEQLFYLLLNHRHKCIALLFISSNSFDSLFAKTIYVQNEYKRISRKRIYDFSERISQQFSIRLMTFSASLNQSNTCTYHNFAIVNGLLKIFLPRLVRKHLKLNSVKRRSWTKCRYPIRLIFFISETISKTI